MRKSSWFIFVLLFLSWGVISTTWQTAGQSRKKSAVPNSQGLSIYGVALSVSSFNPARGEKMEVRYNLSRAAKVTIHIYDADQQLVKTLLSNGARSAGRNRETWDGRDQAGKVVPDEAYFFCLEASDAEQRKAIYDPITFSGGETADLTQGRTSRQSGTISYKLSQPARVLLRAGVPGGALLKTIVDWQPRTSGEITEYWNGWDEDSVIHVWGLKNHTMVLTYMTLPDASVITFGNKEYDFHTYKARIAGARPMKEQRPMANARRLSPHFLKPRSTDHAFKVRLTFPELEKGGTRVDVPSVRDRLLVRVEVPEADKAVLRNQQYEIIFSLDTAFHAEEERGYLPFNFPLDTRKLAAGEHTMTVNIITFGDQIGIGSRKIRVVK
jgi:hypothetical protein